MAETSVSLIPSLYNLQELEVYTQKQFKFRKIVSTLISNNYENHAEMECLEMFAGRKNALR
jgi:hypothetical protein